MSRQPKILLVEDDDDLSMVVEDLLRAEGYQLVAADDGKIGLQLVSTKPFDMLILDWMLPGRSGVDVCQNVRALGFDGAILMLTARGQVQDRVTGLNSGADDYLVKPFVPDELIARVGALLRRVHKESVTPVTRIKFGKVSVDFIRNEFTKEGKALQLTSKEMELLRFLINHRGQTLSRDRILSGVWKEQTHITPRTVDTHVAWLRSKLEDSADAPKHILTIRGQGYRFERGETSDC